MRSVFRNLISCFFACVAFMLLITPTQAMEISVKDEYGNREVLVSIPDEYLQGNGVSTFSMRPIVSPDPDKVAEKLGSLYEPLGWSSIFNDGSGSTIDRKTLTLPTLCNFFLIDFGPNWSSMTGSGVDEVSKTLLGRYCYVFYGYYDKYSFGDTSLRFGVYTSGTLSDTVKYGRDSYSFYSGLDDDAFTPEDNSFIVCGPYAIVFYNPDSDTLHLFEDVYPESKGYAAEVTFTGITSDTDDTNTEYYPRVMTFANYDNQYIETWSSSMWLFDDIFDFAWSSDAPEIDNSQASDPDIWGAIANGNWTGDGISGLLGTALQGVAAIVEFVQLTPTYFSSAANVLPAPFALFIIACFGIIVTIVVFKIAVQIIRG